MLIDTNVLLDVALRRQPYYALASALLGHLAQSPAGAFIAWHTVSNFYYIARPHLGDEETRRTIEELTDFLNIVPTGNESLAYALSLPIADFEDAMQVAAAHAANAQHIVTRDEHDFTNSPIPAITPEQALRELF